MITDVWITPADVSFEAIELHEQEVDAVGTGCFAQYLQTHHIGHHPNPGWTGIVAVEANGSKMSAPDHIAFSGSACAGTITWSIPWEFRVNGGASKLFIVLDQVGTFTANGHVTATKAGATVSSARNDPTETP